MAIRKAGEVEAWDIQPGKSFLWRQETFTVCEENPYEDEGNLLVTDKLGNKIKFNACAYVLPYPHVRR